MDIVEFKNITWDILRNISENMDRLFRPAGEPYGLTVMQVRILREIGDGAHTVGSLGKRMGVAGGNISAMCKKLEREGYVGRSRDIDDERIVNVLLTEKGWTTIQTIGEDIRSLYADIFAQVDQEGLQSAIDGLEEFNRLVETLLIAGHQEEE